MKSNFGEIDNEQRNTKAFHHGWSLTES